MFEMIVDIAPELLLLTYCMVSLLLVSKPRYSMKLTVLIALLFTLLLVIINFAIYLPLGQSMFKKYFVISAFVPEAIVAALLGKRKVLSHVTAIVNAFISFYILFLTVSALSNWIETLNGKLLLISIGSIFLFFYLKKFYVKIHNQIESTLPSFFKYFLIYSLLMLVEITIYQFLIGAVEIKNVLRLEIFGVAILSVYIISIIIMYYLIIKYHAKINLMKDNEWLENHLQFTVEQIKHQERKNKELRILHHDLRHILTTTSTLIQNNENEQALDFLNNYIELINNAKKIRFCEDSLINAALEYYYNICKDNNIKFNCKLNNIEDALKIPSHEIAVVISNCLENAINASLKLEKNRLINFTFLNNNGRLVMKVENNYDGIIELDDKNTPKNNAKNHGIGTASIKHFAKRNDLIVDYEITNKIFKITILFK